MVMSSTSLSSSNGSSVSSQVKGGGAWCTVNGLSAEGVGSGLRVGVATSSEVTKRATESQTRRQLHAGR